MDQIPQALDFGQDDQSKSEPRKKADRANGRNGFFGNQAHLIDLAHPEHVGEIVRHLNEGRPQCGKSDQ